MSGSSCSILYTIFAWFLGMCYGFVLLSSAAGQNGELALFKNGEYFKYQWKTTTLLSEKSDNTKNVGFSITGHVLIQVVWGNGAKKLLKIQIDSPRLHIRSRKAPTPDDFSPHSSVLDDIIHKPFLVIWENGKIESLLLDKNETLALGNIKKGITSLLQIQSSEGTIIETDVSGKCTVSYSPQGSTELMKIKTDCTSDDLELLKEDDAILGTKSRFSSLTRYEFDTNSPHLKQVSSNEFHAIYYAAKEEIGSQIRVDQSLSLIDSGNVESIQTDRIEEAVKEIELLLEKVSFVKENLLIKADEVVVEKITEFSKHIKNLKDYLKTAHLGTLKPTKAFLKLINVARSAAKEEISKTLTQKKNKDILPQLYDILGYAQTDDSHAAVSKAIYLEKEEHLDYNERYLWALSFSPWPNPVVVEDLLKKFVKTNLPSKVKETLILTIASMARKLSKLPYSSTKLAREVEETILNNLDYAKNAERFVYFRALKNLQSPKTIKTLLKYAQKGTQKEGVLAWKALRSFKPIYWDETILQAAKKTCFQLDRTYDSSSRAIAIDILLDSKPSDILLEDMLNFVASNDTAYEIRQYTLQKIRLISDKNQEFGSRVQKVVKSNPRINNYSGLSPRGLSTALERRFLTSSSANGSLISLQEIKTGIVKRGTVSIELEKDEAAQEIFSLGLTAGGLSSFMSSNDNDATDKEEEAVTAGMELTFAGTQIRPFVFFNGQGELMGHVWSGTASEMTPAFQGLVLLQDHLEYLRLGSGFVAKLNLRTAVSFDLSGKIEISLWNRNAESIIQTSAGLLMSGSTAIDSTIVKTQLDYSGTTETKLNFQSDIDFSSNVKFCMRLSQPDAVFRHNVFKTERIPNTKFSMKISNYRISQVPGMTYSINRKNNEMCSLIFN